MRKRPNYYYVQTDSDGYVVAVTKTGNERLDTVELDLSQYNLIGEYTHTYKLVDGQLVQDPEKLAEVEAEITSIYNSRRIKFLKERLAETDYITSKYIEEIMALDNRLTWIVDVIAINLKYLNEYRQVLKDRSAWRKEINELGGGD